jgi:hypothetical protein
MIVEMLPKYSFPHEAAIQINLPVLLFSVVRRCVTGILFGLWPARSFAARGQSGHAGTYAKIAGGVRGRTTHNVLIAGKSR